MRPEDLLPDQQDHVQCDGISIRKGSVGAFLVSARQWLDPACDAQTRTRAEADLRALMPGLHALGLFEVVAPRDPALRRFIEQSR